MLKISDVNPFHDLYLCVKSQFEHQCIKDNIKQLYIHTHTQPHTHQMNVLLLY